VPDPKPRVHYETNPGVQTDVGKALLRDVERRADEKADAERPEHRLDVKRKRAQKKKVTPSPLTFVEMAVLANGSEIGRAHV